MKANDARKELYEKDKEIHDLKQDILGLKQALKDANDQCILLFNEVQKAWKVSLKLQSDLKVLTCAFLYSNSYGRIPLTCG